MDGLLLHPLLCLWAYNDPCPDPLFGVCCLCVRTSPQVYCIYLFMHVSMLASRYVLLQLNSRDMDPCYPLHMEENFRFWRWSRRCSPLQLHSFSLLDCSSHTWDLLGNQKYPQQKAAGEENCHPLTQAHLSSWTLRLCYAQRIKYTHTLTLQLCKSYECRSIESISPSFRYVRLLDGSLGMLCVCTESFHVGEIGGLLYIYVDIIVPHSQLCSTLPDLIHL